MIEVLGRRTSGNVMPVLWAAEELGLEVRQVDVGGPFGGNDQPEYLAKNPNGLVPTLVDDGFVLWESNAIVRYLCAGHGSGTLYPEERRQRALADQWMDWKQTTVIPMMTPIFVGLVRTAPEDRDEERIARSIERGRAVWSLLDRHLEGRQYLLGDALTMADLPLGPQIFRWYQLVEDRPRLPHLDAWYRRLGQRPAYRRHCMNPLA